MADAGDSTYIRLSRTGPSVGDGHIRMYQTAHKTPFSAKLSQPRVSQPREEMRRQTPHRFWRIATRSRSLGTSTILCPECGLAAEKTLSVTAGRGRGGFSAERLVSCHSRPIEAVRWSPWSASRIRRSLNVSLTPTSVCCVRSTERAAASGAGSKMRSHDGTRKPPFIMSVSVV